MAKREFLMQAHKVKSLSTLKGYLLSEKLDGMRCFWDGGISRGLPATTVPWANTTKDSRLKDTRHATGLWSRYMKPIHAPEAWLDKMPSFPLDGELWAGRGGFQQVMSACKKLTPVDSEWDKIMYMIFESPPLDVIFSTGHVKHTQCNVVIDGRAMDFVLRQRPKEIITRITPFCSVYDSLVTHTPVNGTLCVMPQVPVTDEAMIEKMMESVLASGGEGLMFRDPMSYWMPQRSHSLLKYKPFSDAEGIVVGYVGGRATDLGSKLLGKMGALILDFEGKRLELSGFTDDERGLAWIDLGHKVSAETAAKQMYAGVELPENMQAYNFPRGSTVTFKYRELSDTGIPKEARYWRKL